MVFRVKSSGFFARKPDALIFDLDNTLYDYRAPHQAAMEAARQKAVSALKIDERTFDAAYERGRSATKARLGATAASHSRLLYFQSMLEDLGMKTQVLLTLDLEQTYWRNFLMNAALFPGVHDFLTELRALGVPTALVTDLTAQIQFRKLIYFGIESFFDYVVTSEEAGADKPMLEPYRLIARKLALADNHEIWTVSDDPAHIDAARKVLNTRTLVKLAPGDPACEGADVEFSDFRELLGQILKRRA